MRVMGEGRQTGKVKASGAKKDSMCVRMCARVCVCAYMSSLGLLYPVYVCMFL